MTTLRLIELRCPACESQFRSQAFDGTYTFQGKRTDFHERATGEHPLPHQVHTCTECGYGGTERDFAPDAEISPAVMDHILSELAPVAGNNPTGSAKYEAAAKVAKWQGQGARYIADLLLRAAWCCVDEGDVEAERFFRRKAAWKLEEALESYDGVPRDERAVLTYLVGELWRRAGNDEKANRWFNVVPLEITDNRAQKWILDAATQQRDNPREWLG